MVSTCVPHTHTGFLPSFHYCFFVFERSHRYCYWPPLATKTIPFFSFALYVTIESKSTNTTIELFLFFQLAQLYWYRHTALALADSLNQLKNKNKNVLFFSFPTLPSESLSFTVNEDSGSIYLSFSHPHFFWARCCDSHVPAAAFTFSTNRKKIT